MPDIAQPKTIDTLLIELYKAGFVYKTRVRIKEDRESNIIKK